MRLIVLVTLAALTALAVTASAARPTGREEAARRLDPDALGLPEDWLADAAPRRLPERENGLSPKVTSVPGRYPGLSPKFPEGTVPGGTVPSGAVSVPDFSREPGIRQVQQAAIRYAEVMPEKIQRWRTRAAWRAWVPRFTLSLDRDTDTTIGSSSSGGKTTFTVGPEDTSVGLNYDFTWDLADLVWSTAQTSIDVRSRLMVQLRNEILDEVTQLYFERRRLQVEDAAAPVKEPSLRAERSLRIDELTAQLDALTGGDFSARISSS